VIGIPVGIYLDRVETRAAVPVAAAVLPVGSTGDWVAASGGSVSLPIASRLLAGVGGFALRVVPIHVASSTFPPAMRGNEPAAVE